MPSTPNKKATARGRTAAARAAQLRKRTEVRGEGGSGGPPDPQVDQPVVPPPLVEEDPESPPSPGAQARSDAAFQAFLQRQLNEMAAPEAEENGGVRARTPEPAHRRDFECLRCVQSALHGDSSGWCVPASSSRTLKCQRCALGKTPCITIVEGSELCRLAQEFLAAKRGNTAPSVLSRATSALRSRIAFEQTLPQGDVRRGTQKCGEVAPVPPSRNAPVLPASLGDHVSSTTSAVANECQANAVRVAIDSLVSQSMPASIVPAYKLLMDQYAAILGGQRR